MEPCDRRPSPLSRSIHGDFDILLRKPNIAEVVSKAAVLGSEDLD